MSLVASARAALCSDRAAVDGLRVLLTRLVATSPYGVACTVPKVPAGSKLRAALCHKPAQPPKVPHLHVSSALCLPQAKRTLQAAICTATTTEDLFPRGRPEGSLDIARQLFNAVASNYSLLVPSPTAGFTLFATSDAGYAKSQQGALRLLPLNLPKPAQHLSRLENLISLHWQHRLQLRPWQCMCTNFVKCAGPRAQAVQSMLNMPPDQLATWVLYSFSYLAYSSDQLMPLMPTELSARTLNTSYVISATGTAPNLVSCCHMQGCLFTRSKSYFLMAATRHISGVSLHCAGVGTSLKKSQIAS